jgi:hypothetical protein
MKATEMLNQVKNLLGVELSDVKLAQLKLENGTVLEADAFEAGIGAEAIRELLLNIDLKAERDRLRGILIDVKNFYQSKEVQK